MIATLTSDVLNLGCGLKPIQGAVNLDCAQSTNPDVLHDLNEFPWPLCTGSFREIHAYDVIEHLGDVVAVIEELHRVATPGGVVHITVPHYSCSNAFTDPTHRHYFSAASINYFTGDSAFPFYSPVRFRLLTRQIVFRKSIANRVVARLANRWPERYENRWAWIFPAWYLYFQIEALK
jgi:hypothetical protein